MTMTHTDRFPEARADTGPFHDLDPVHRACVQSATTPRPFGACPEPSCADGRRSGGPVLTRRFCVKRVDGPDAGEWMMIHPYEILYVFLPKAVRPGARGGAPRVRASWVNEVDLGTDAVHVRCHRGIFRTVHPTLNSFLRVVPIELLYANQSVAVNLEWIADFERSNPRKPLIRFDVDPDRWRWNLEYVGVSRRNVPHFLELFGLKTYRPAPASTDSSDEPGEVAAGGR
jgi:hypothetical protein